MANKEFSSVQAEGKSVVIYCRDDYARQKVKELEDTYKAAISDKVVPCQSLPQQPITGKEKWVYRLAGDTSYSDYMWDADATPAGWILMSTSNHGIDSEPTPGSTNLAESGGIAAWGNRNFAKPFGFYDGMTVGTSRNLLGKATVTETFWKKILGTGIAKGLGYVDKVQGESIAWGQLVQNGNEEYWKDFTAIYCTLTEQNGIALLTVNSQEHPSSRLEYKYSSSFLTGHKLYIVAYVNPPKTTTCKFFISGYSQPVECELNKWSRVAGVLDVGANRECGLYFNTGGVFQEGDVVQVKNINIIDLTAKGIDNLTTAEEVEAWLAAHPGEADYYAYDAGSLLSVKMQNVKTVGFNRWDEQWEQGVFDNQGNPLSYAADTIRSKNYIPVVAGQNYYIRCSMNIGCPMYFFDANKVFIASNTIQRTNSTFTPPGGARYMKFRLEYPVYGANYKHDICINFSNTALNGTYMPYQTATRPLDVTNITGINPTTGTREKCFPNGMRSAGTAHDEIVVEGGAVKAIQRVGSVNLGDLSWGAASAEGRCNSNALADIKPITYSGQIANILCANWSVVTARNWYSNMIGIAQLGQGYGQPESIGIVDSGLASKTGPQIQTAMSGVLLFYELAEPVVYTDLQDADGNPIILPLGIPVEPLGTLEVLPENTEGEALTMCAPTLTLRMSIDAVHLLTDEVPATYQTYAIDKQNMNALVAAINQYLGATMGGTFSVVENADKSLSITFTAASNNQND